MDYQGFSQDFETISHFLLDIFFSAEDYTNVVVLDQSTVTFQKG
jgi:hypothetical protein